MLRQGSVRQSTASQLGSAVLIRVRFVRDKVAQGQNFLPVLRISPVIVIPPILHPNKVMPGNLPKINILSEIGEHWIESSLDFFYYKWLISVVYTVVIQNVS
jgi:hypothetical protein